MINKHDIEDLSGYTQKPLADNHAGWNVEELTKHNGWIPCIPYPYPDITDAEEYLDFLQKLFPKIEFRVYEALK